MFTQQQINLFLSLCDTESFAKTAVVFNISRQAVCKTINTIEQSLGCTLFMRKGHSLKLNDYGMLVKNHMLSEQFQYQKLLSLIEEHKASEKEVFRIGLQTNLMLKKESLAVSICLNESTEDYAFAFDRGSSIQLAHGLENGSFDLVIVNESLVENKKKYSSKKIRDIEMIMLVSKSHPKIRKDSTYMDFCSSPFALDRFEGENEAAYKKRASRIISRFDLTPSMLVETDNAESVYLNITAGNCISITTCESWYFNSTRLIAYPLNQKDSLVCLWRKNDNNPLIRKFINVLEGLSNDK